MNCQDLFHYLWSPSKHFKAQFILPDTIIYKDHKPLFWLFTAKDGSIKKKLPQSITKQHMRQRFSRGNQQSGVWAVFIYESLDDIYGKIQLPKQSRGSVFLSPQQFQLVLQGGITLTNGVLQKFVDTGFLNNSMIQVVQTKYFTTFTKRTSKLALKSNDQQLFNRCITFEGPEIYSYTNILKGQLTFTLKHIVNCLTERVEQVSNKTMTMKQLTAFFKKDIKGKIYFLYSTTKARSIEQQLQATPKQLKKCQFCQKITYQTVQTVYRVLSRGQQNKFLAKKIFRGGPVNQQHRILVCDNCFFKYSGQQQQGDINAEIEKIAKQHKQVQKQEIEKSRTGMQSVPQLPSIRLRTKSQSKIKKVQKAKPLFKKLQNLMSGEQGDKLDPSKLRVQIDYLRNRIPLQGQLRLRALEQILDSLQ